MGIEFIELKIHAQCLCMSLFDILPRKKKDTKYLQILEKLETMEPYAKYGLEVNVDFYAAVIYHLLGIPDDMFVSVFITSRIVGWAAQIKEQKSNNILIRPNFILLVLWIHPIFH